MFINMMYSAIFHCIAAVLVGITAFLFVLLCDWVASIHWGFLVVFPYIIIKTIIEECKNAERN